MRENWKISAKEIPQWIFNLSNKYNEHKQKEIEKEKLKEKNKNQNHKNDTNQNNYHKNNNQSMHIYETTQIQYLEVSLLDTFGMKELYTFFSVPFLRMKVLFFV